MAGELMFKHEKTFSFKNLKIEVTTAQLPYRRIYGSAAGISFTIVSSYPGLFPAALPLAVSERWKGSFNLSTDSFSTKGKKPSEYFPTYRKSDIEKANSLNMLAHLKEIIEQYGDEEEKATLQALMKHTEDSFTATWTTGTLPNPQAADRIIQEIKTYVISGKRIDLETLELIDASPVPRQEIKIVKADSPAGEFFAKAPNEQEEPTEKESMNQSNSF